MSLKELEEDLCETSAEIEHENEKMMQQKFCHHNSIVYLCNVCGLEVNPPEDDGKTDCNNCKSIVGTDVICTDCDAELGTAIQYWTK